MLTRKVLVGYFLTSLFAFPVVRAQQPSPPSPIAPPVGLLLARVAHERNRDVFGDVSMVRYETLWIVRDAAGARIAATLPDIIVPRKSGFWRIGIEHTCQLTPAAPGDSNDHGNISTADIPFAVPVRQAPVVDLDHPVCDAQTAKRLFDDFYNPEFVPEPDSEHPPNPNAPSECGWANRWFESVLPDLISISYFQGVSEICEPQGGNDYKEIWVQSPDDPFPLVGPAQQQIPFNVVFGAAGHRAWIRAVSGGQREGDSCITDNPDEDMQQTGRSLKHVHGEWRARFRASRSRVCGVRRSQGCSAAYAHSCVPIPIPWAALQKQLLGISDAYGAPSASVLLAIQSTKGDPVSEEGQTVAVALYDFSRNKLGAKLLDLPAKKILMIEWATGRFVQSWTESLSALQAHGLPAVIVRVRAASK